MVISFSFLACGTLLILRVFFLPLWLFMIQFGLLKDIVLPVEWTLEWKPQAAVKMWMNAFAVVMCSLSVNRLVQLFLLWWSTGQGFFYMNFGKTWIWVILNMKKKPVNEFPLIFIFERKKLMYDFLTTICPLLLSFFKWILQFQFTIPFSFWIVSVLLEQCLERTA